MAFFTQTRVGVRSRSSLTGSWEMESKDASLTVEGLSRRLLKCYFHLSLIPFLSLFRLAPSAERSGVVLGVRGPCTDLTALTNISGLWVWVLRSTFAFPSHQVSCISLRSVCVFESAGVFSSLAWRQMMGHFAIPGMPHSFCPAHCRYPHCSYQTRPGVSFSLVQGLTLLNLLLSACASSQRSIGRKLVI